MVRRWRGGSQVKKLPGYRVRESNKAKRVQLKMSLRRGLEIVVPSGFNHQNIPGVLERNRRWLERAARRVQVQGAWVAPSEQSQVPELLRLRAIDEEWQVHYREQSLSGVKACELEPRVLQLYGDSGDTVEACAAVQAWLHLKARRHLVPWLQELARQRGFRVTRIRVGCQKTRWGSCSRRGTISLNLKTLFFPRALTRCILLHELCHTVHLDHSDRFWALLNYQEPDSRRLHDELRSAWRFIPAWLDA